MTPAPNYGLKDEIRAYWAQRSRTFDLSPGHKIRSGRELAAWVDLFRAHAPFRAGDRVLDLASGTGEVTRVLLALGCRVDALDLTEAMIDRARAKLAGEGEPPVRFVLADAENTMLADGAYDAVVCRHLVWTLVDPRAAFADWHRVLRPGGSLVIVDGDWVGASAPRAWLRRLGALWDRLVQAPRLWDEAAHRRIMAGIHFRGGLRAAALGPMLVEAGFEGIRVGTLGRVRRAQLAAATWRERLSLVAEYEHTFVLAARRPAAGSPGR